MGEFRRRLRAAVTRGPGARLSVVAATLRLEGVFSVLPTAFDDDGALDLDGTAALAQAHVEAAWRA